MSQFHITDILVISASEAMRCVVHEAAQATFGSSVHVRSFTFEKAQIFLRHELMEQSDLLIVDLLREYRSGVRAEGLAIVDRWWQGKPFLVLSLFAMNDELNCSGYWDLGANDSLGTRIQKVSLSVYDCWAQFEIVKKRFARASALPNEH